jgi:putative endonuclease
MTRERIKDLGETGENRAAAFLDEKQFNIITRNFRSGRSGEIDIVAQKGYLIIFAEVKYRMSDAFGGALYSISNKKKRSLKTTAKAFLYRHPEFDRPEFTYRFDLISIGNNSVDWIEDILR